MFKSLSHGVPPSSETKKPSSIPKSHSVLGKKRMSPQRQFFMSILRCNLFSGPDPLLPYEQGRPTDHIQEWAHLLHPWKDREGQKPKTLATQQQATWLSPDYKSQQSLSTPFKNHIPSSSRVLDASKLSVDFPVAIRVQQVPALPFHLVAERSSPVRESICKLSGTTGREARHSQLHKHSVDRIYILEAHNCRFSGWPGHSQLPDHITWGPHNLGTAKAACSMGTYILLKMQSHKRIPRRFQLTPQ